MYNSTAYNTSPYWYSPLTLDTAQDSIVFDGFSLQNANIITSRIDYDNEGNIELNSFNFPKSDGGGVLSKYFRGRTISIECTIKSDTAENFNTLLDMVKKKLRTTEWYLDITVNGEIRRIKATLTKFDAGRMHYNVTFTKATLEFTAIEPFFYAKNKQSYEFLGVTGTSSYEVSNDGSVESQPVFYIIGTSWSSVTSLAITAFGKTLTISTTISSWDILIVSSEEKTVTKNGVEIDYTGYFPVFPPGSNPFTITTVGTIALDITLIQNKNYL